ncbi:MAG: elongation factor P [Acidobacteria bacterium]|nr:elongation factor P [Acidobacteriota bacterium]
MISATRIRKGMILLYEGVPHRVLDFHHHTPGNLRAMVHTKLRNLKTGSSTDVRFRASDTVEKASLEEHEMEYLYSDGSMHHFMNSENFEQVALDSEMLGDCVDYLTQNLKIQVEFFEGKPIGVELPPVVELTVVETEPELRGATVSNVTKPAKLETGVIVQVPAFIKEGERIRVDPNDGRYVERAR